MGTGIIRTAAELAFIVFLCRNYLGGWFTDSPEVAAMLTPLSFPFLVYQTADG